MPGILLVIEFAPSARGWFLGHMGGRFVLRDKESSELTCTLIPGNHIDFLLVWFIHDSCS